MNAGPAGFTNAPVLKALCLTTTGSSVLWQAMQQNFVKPISPVLKPFVRAFVFKKTGELIFGVALLYYFRILERQTGSRKFGAYAVVVSTISFGLQSAIETAYKLKPLPSGPYGFIFASFLSLVFDIPPSQRLSFCGVPLSDKAFTYIMGLPLMFSNGTASMMAAACGVLAGFTYNSNLFNIRKFRFPVFVNLLLSNTVGRLLMGRSDRPIITMNSTRTTRHRQSQNTGQNSQSRGVVVSETAIQQLLSMGFEEDRVRTALQMTNNDIQSAIAIKINNFSVKLATEMRALHDAFIHIRPIDSGSFGTVVLSRDKLTGEDVAIKKIERGPNVDKHVLNEIRNHRRLHHEHIIKFKDCYLTQTHLCIVMEYAVGGNLKMYIKDFKGLDENTARWFFQQLMLALQYCHKMRVANRDIKLDNLLLDATDEWPMLKMCDFGYSKDEEMNSAPHSTVGTPLYLAPEVIMKEPDDIYDGKKSDIWSCGVVLYAMIFNCYPFVKREDLASHCVFVRIAKKVCENPLSFPTNTEASEDVRDLLTKMLEKDPERRITLDEILEHRWFRFRLPEGALDMNNEVECQDYRLQSDSKINTLIEEAKIPYCIENEDLIQHFS